MQKHDSLLTTKDAAAQLGIHFDTLKQIRRGGRGPAFYRIGGLVKYSIADLEQYKIEHHVTPEEVAVES